MDDPAVLLDAQIQLPGPLHLQHLAPAQVAGGFGCQLDETYVIQPGQKLKGDGEERVAADQGHPVTVDTAHRRQAAPVVGLVQDVVVDERGHVDELDGGGRFDQPVRFPSLRPCR